MTLRTDTIAAIATPPGTGAVALLRVSGPEARKVVAETFRGRKSSRWEPRRQHLGRVLDEDGETIDEVLITYFPAPHSFTGEEVVEIATHGGVVVTNRVLRRMLETGAVPAEPGEFSQRAFLNGKIDLTQAEAIMDLISAQTDLAAKAATEQLAGTLGTAIESIRGELVGLTAHIEAYIDFPEEDIDPDSADTLLRKAQEIRGKIDRLLETADQGRILREGIRTVICGAPNAGKSSLLNVLLGFDRAIVNEKAGTTRDTIEEVINLRGIPVRLIDTAGIRKGGDEIESEGIERSRRQLETAELVLFVIDSHESRDAAIAIEIPARARVLRILNKSDLGRHPDWSVEAGEVAVSCHAPEAAEILREALYDFITVSGKVDTTNLTAINRRHQDCLVRAKEAIRRAERQLTAGVSPEFVAMDFRASLDALVDVVGRTDVEEILSEIFSSFCIGK